MALPHSSVASQDVEVTCGDDAVIVLIPDECRQVGNDTLRRGLRDNPIASGRGVGRMTRCELRARCSGARLKSGHGRANLSRAKRLW